MGSSLNDNFLPNIGQMTSLKVLNIGFTDNNFEGTLPSCLGNMTSLRWLSFSGNNLHGNIAVTFYLEETHIT
ncbi:hypothetical protein RDI58_019703 [Solanum bulbocastanum]|uniref:Non-specific serine/threonine protein kinase n=1 Tax=Solanum bulbocastanum TaxID=147425 RepID=A0AAN8TB41_SOLBU